MDVRNLVEGVGIAVDVAGVIIIVVSILVASVGFGRGALRREQPFEESYRALRQGIGRGILLGLELLVAGDIIRTVAIEPSFVSVGVLAFIVLVRTFLSFVLEIELTGQLPWAGSNKRRHGRADATPTE